MKIQPSIMQHIPTAFAMSSVAAGKPTTFAAKKFLDVAKNDRLAVIVGKAVDRPTYYASLFAAVRGVK